MTYSTRTTFYFPPRRCSTCAVSASVPHAFHVSQRLHLIYVVFIPVLIHLCCVSDCTPCISCTSASVPHKCSFHTCPNSPVLCQRLYPHISHVSQRLYLIRVAFIPALIHLCCVSVDRYVAITDPFNYDRKMTPRFVAWLLAGVWTASALVSHLPTSDGNKGDLQVGLTILIYCR